METLELQTLIDALKLARVKPANELHRIDLLIAKYQSELQGLTAVVLKDSTEVSKQETTKTTTENSFPVSTPQAQILYVLEKTNLPMKMAEIAEAIKKETGEYVEQMADIVRKMHKAGSLKMLKINNSNKMSFWILKDWYNKENNTLKSRDHFDYMDLIYGMSNVEYL